MTIQPQHRTASSASWRKGKALVEYVLLSSGMLIQARIAAAIALNGSSV